MWKGRKTFNSQYIMDEEGRLLRDIGLIRERWVRWFHKLLNTNHLPLIQLSPTSSRSGPRAVAGRRPV